MDKSLSRIGHYLAKNEATLLECLQGQAGLGRSTAEWLLQFGAIYVDRQRVHGDRPIGPGQYIRVHFDPKRYPVCDVDWRTSIVHGEDSFVVVQKPPEIPVHPTVDNQAENVLHQLSVVFGQPLYVTQRLDVRVSGLIVIARTKEFQRQFNGLLINRRVRKHYRALVTTPPAQGRHVHFMVPSERSPRMVMPAPFPHALECALTVTGVKPFVETSSSAPFFEVEIDLETGRTHQIRAQLAAMGSPIVGDFLYGSPDRFEISGNCFSGIALFSASVSWSGRDGEVRSFTRTPPWS